MFSIPFFLFAISFQDDCCLTVCSPNRREQVNEMNRQDTCNMVSQDKPWQFTGVLEGYSLWVHRIILGSMREVEQKLWSVLLMSNMIAVVMYSTCYSHHSWKLHALTPSRTQLLPRSQTTSAKAIVSSAYTTQRRPTFPPCNSSASVKRTE